MFLSFEKVRSEIEGQFSPVNWIEESGIDANTLEKEIFALCAEGGSRAVIKARSFRLIAERSRIAIDKKDIFQDKLFAGGLLVKQRSLWEKEIKDRYLPDESRELQEAWACGAYRGESDFGHTSPNSRLLLSVGFGGLKARIEEGARSSALSEKQKDFYTSCLIVLEGLKTAALRLSNAIRPYDEKNAEALLHIAEHPPRDSYEAMQLLIFYFFMHEYVFGTRVRTLGRLDVLLTPFYRADLENGTYTKEELRGMLKFFLHKFWAAKVAFDLPFCLGGIDSDGNEVTNEVSRLIVEVYRALDIHSPKIHIRVSEQTPKDFLLLVLSSIRAGNSSFVFVNDRIGIEALRRVGCSERDARDYVPIGCYEPAVWGAEIGCTGNGGVSLAKAVELTLTGGYDLKSGKRIGCAAESIRTFDGFFAAVKAQISHMAEKAMDYITKIEGYYAQIGPDPMLSMQYSESVREGVDVMEGGAKYNNSSLYFYFIATLVDSLCAVKRLVFDEKRFSLEGLYEMLRADWQGYEAERQYSLRIEEKYGNGNPTADAITKEVADFCAALVNAKPNGRGGVFKAALFSIDRYVKCGEQTMATPDGRHAGDILSKNLCATVGMDQNGITSLIRSATAFDHALFPNGSVLDILLHPSAVSGEDGMTAFLGILLTYFKRGGFAMHGNVFDAKLLREAQMNPQKYKTLQVRVCGWNAYFVNLSRAEQDAFIRQAEGN